MPSTPVRLVFVYGTLRRGQERDIERLQPPGRWRGKARVRGELFQLGLYPGLRLGPEGWVQGEVYEISHELEEMLDLIKEVASVSNSEYLKREVLVQLESPHGRGETVRCLVYEATPGVVQCKPLIASGDWATVWVGPSG